MMRRGSNIQLLEDIVEMLLDGIPLPEANHDHALSGTWVNHRECHIQPDWLLIYYIERNVLVLTLTRTGSHSELFNE
ncbi:MAG: type II toxin-antitoxin system YafQ family toxin [Clostridia bacterium]